MTTLFSHQVEFKGERITLSLTTTHITLEYRAKPPKAIPLSALRLYQVSSTKSFGCSMRVSVFLQGKERKLKFEFTDDNAAAALQQRDLWERALKRVIDGETLEPPRKPSQAAVAAAAAAGATPTTPTTPCAPSAPLPLAEAKARASLLARDRALKQSHVELVERGVLSEEEFWSSRHQQLLLSAERVALRNQATGVSSTPLKRGQSVANQVNLRFTPDAIRSICAQYPAVHRAYLDHVPDKMTEQQFWTKYAQSHYYHHGTTEPDKFFARYEDDAGESDDRGAAASANVMDRGRLERARKKPQPELLGRAVDLTASVDDDAVAAADIFQDAEVPRSQSRSKEVRRRERLIDSLNKRSARVATFRAGAATATATPTATPPDRNMAATPLLDLQADAPSQHRELEIRDSWRYFGGVGPITEDAGRSHETDQAMSDHHAHVQQVIASAHALAQEQPSWHKLAHHEPARTALLHLTHQNRGMNRAMASSRQARRHGQPMGRGEAVVFSTSSEADVRVDEAFETQLVDVFHQAAEFLRHFYACVPVTRDTLERLQRMSVAIRKLLGKIQEWRRSLHRLQKSALVPMLGPLEHALAQALKLSARIEERRKKREEQRKQQQQQQT